jgi:hypothetical protein
MAWQAAVCRDISSGITHLLHEFGNRLCIAWGESKLISQLRQFESEIADG